MKVVNNQNILDIATQQSGSVLSALDWAIANNISITDELVAGKVLVSVESLYQNIDIANFFAGKSQLIATSIHQAQITQILNLGIGTMKLEKNFIIN